MSKIISSFKYLLNKLFVTEPRYELVPRLKYSPAAGGWVLVGIDKKSKNKIVPSRTGFNLLTGRVQSFLMALLFVAVSMSGAFVYSLYGKPAILPDYLCYAFPSLAGIFGGMGIYFEEQAKKMFWLAATCLASGMYLYFDIHSQIKAIGLLVLVSIVVLIAALFFFVNNKMNGYGRSKWERRLGVAASFLMMAFALYLAYVAIHLLRSSEISPFSEKVLQEADDNSYKKCDANEDKQVAKTRFDFGCGWCSMAFHDSCPPLSNCH